MTGALDKAREFDALDAHGVQEALREEMGGDVTEDGAGENIDGDNTDAKNTQGDAIELGDAADDEDAIDSKANSDVDVDVDVDSEANQQSEPLDGGEAAPEVTAVWTAAQMADHVRMAEALLFAAVEPLDEASIADRLPAGADVPALMEALKAQYENRGVNLSKITNKWRFVTSADVAHVLEKERVEPRKLSRAALETLAIIGYHQPCTRADIEDVRGVAVSRGSLDQLMEIGWVRLRGRRKDVPGRPVLYGTTQSFLEHFGLESLADLPGMADLKAAGLLDARLPPGFSIPTPRDVADGEAEADEETEAAEFAQDFHGDDVEIEADGDTDPENSDDGA